MNPARILIVDDNSAHLKAGQTVWLDDRGGSP
jgi:hypothetical protein